MFDIDDFKNVNDSRGHIFGDQVLIEVASIIKNNIRDTDFAGRYGGEEFMVIFSGTDFATTVKVAERIRYTIEKHTFTGEISITISGGIKQFMGGSLTDFVHQADMNLYKAKQGGKNQIIYDLDAHP